MYMCIGARTQIPGIGINVVSYYNLTLKQLDIFFKNIISVFDFVCCEGSIFVWTGPTQ